MQSSNDNEASKKMAVSIAALYMVSTTVVSFLLTAFSVEVSSFVLGMIIFIITGLFFISALWTYACFMSQPNGSRSKIKYYSLYGTLLYIYRHCKKIRIIRVIFLKLLIIVRKCKVTRHFNLFPKMHLRYILALIPCFVLFFSLL